ncbi:MAG: hypothetical protein WCK42_09310 [Myxococcaceae bacterium]
MQRVEPKLDLNGRGMAASPEKIQDLIDETARKERSNAPKPKTPFKKIIHDKGLK